MNTQQIATNKTFQAFAIIEALSLISKDTGISYDALFAQFPTNKDLQDACAKVVVETAKLLTAK
jgi:hypothetical protein